jgi:signal transduction histidine kinase
LQELLGHRSRDILPPDVAAQHEAHDAQVLRDNEPIDVEEVVPSAEGPRTFLSTKFVIPAEPPLVGAIATEITDRKLMEHELRIAVKTREDILAVVSHDLRSPLQTVQLAVSMLQAQYRADPRERRYLELIHRSSLRMDTLIDDLLDTATIRAGRLVLDVKREPLDSVVSEAVDLQEALAAEKGIALVRARNVEGIEVTCDRGRILQVFGNLIGNAIKFCRTGDSITVGVEPAGDFVQLSVSNTGPGIEADVLPYLFDAYWSGAEHASQGSGLGLFICRGIVEGHGGRIWAESPPGETGVRFLFTLPIARG